MQEAQLKDPVTEDDWRRATFTDEFGTVPLLVDADKQIYRFAGCVCRVLRREVASWTMAKAEVGNSPSHLGVYYNAPNTAFGVSVPDRPFDPYTTRNMWLIDLAFGNPYFENASELMVRQVLTQPQLREKPLALDWIYSAGFNAYRTPIGDSLVLVNPDLNGGVFCEKDLFRWPNPNCEGLILFDEKESASFTMHATLLPKLEEVIQSIRSLQASIRTHCPVNP